MQPGARQAGSLDNQLGGVSSSDIVVNADPWSPLQLYSIYRLILAVIFITLSMTDISSVNIGTSQSDLFSLSVKTYLGFTVLGVFLAYFRNPVQLNNFI